MLIAVFSDVHGNLPALEKFEQCTRGRVDGYVCLGDVVNYGPWNDECLDLIFTMPDIVFLQGNHERLFLGEETIHSELPLVQEFYAHSVQRFTRIESIKNLPREHYVANFTMTHTINDRRIYVDTPIDIDRNYMIGHTHHAFDVERSGYRLINCGSIGQNRRRLDRLNYALLDSNNAQVRLMEEEYPVHQLLTEMEHLGYPKSCLDYYQSKIP